MKKLFSLFLLTFTLAIVFAFSAFGVVSASPQNITQSTILPETDQLKIAWSYSSFQELTATATSWNQPLDGRINFTTTDNYIWLAGSYNAGDNMYWFAIKTGTSTILIYEENWFTWNCGLNGDESCADNQFVVFSTIGMTESQRTITSTDIDSGVTITYEDLNPAYNITYNLDGGTNNPSNPANFVADDLPFDLLDPTPPDGYNFVAWHDAVTLDSPITDITVEDDIEIWAEYELPPSSIQPQQHTLDFDFVDDSGHRHWLSASWPSHIIQGDDLLVTVILTNSESPESGSYPFIDWVYRDRDFSGATDLSYSTAHSSAYRELTAIEITYGIGSKYVFSYNTSDFTVGDYTALFYGVAIKVGSNDTDTVYNLDQQLSFTVAESIDVESEDLGVFFVDYDDPVTLEDIKAEITVLDYEENDISDQLQVWLDEYSVSDKSLGDYLMILYADDAYDNRTYVELTVRVVDITGPVITLNGDSTVYVEFGSNYTEPGATVTDNTDPDPSLTITGTVNVGVLGSYTRTYTATDASGNETVVTRTVIVQDTTAPVITFDATYESNTEVAYDLAHFLSSITAYDTHDGDVTSSITVVTDNYTGNELTPGSYTVTISVEDAAGNETVETFTITVVNYFPPTITASDYLVSHEVADAMTQEQIVAHIASKNE